MEAKEEASCRIEFTTDILTALIPPVQLLHDSGYIHADLKPDNLMYDADTGTVTIIDFGSVVPLNKEGEAPNPFMGGTFLYMDAERMLNSCAQCAEESSCKARPAVDW